MNNYDEFEDKQKALEDKADSAYEGTGIIINWAFLLVGIAITGAATHFLTSAATRNAPIYQQFLGADNAAWLTVAILEGTLIGLLVGQQSFFKEQDQRSLARVGQYIVWLILAFNTVCAFVVWNKGAAALPRPMELYAVWGLPVIVCGAILLWKEMWTRRRAGKQTALALATNAEVNALWRKQYVANTAAYQKAVQKVSLSPDIQLLREALAKEDVIADLAKQHNMDVSELKQILERNPRALTGMYGQTVDGHIEREDDTDYLPRRVNGAADPKH